MIEDCNYIAKNESMDKAWHELTFSSKACSIQMLVSKFCLQQICLHLAKIHQIQFLNLHVTSKKPVVFTTLKSCTLIGL